MKNRLTEENEQRTSEVLPERFLSWSSTYENPDCRNEVGTFEKLKRSPWSVVLPVESVSR